MIALAAPVVLLPVLAEVDDDDPAAPLSELSPHAASIEPAPIAAADAAKPRRTARRLSGWCGNGESDAPSTCEELVPMADLSLRQVIAIRIANPSAESQRYSAVPNRSHNSSIDDPPVAATSPSRPSTARTDAVSGGMSRRTVLGVSRSAPPTSAIAATMRPR